MRLAPFLVAFSAAVAHADRPVRVYVDLSREYSPEWASLAGVEGFEATVGFATPSAEPLAAYDVVVVYYSHGDAPWTAIMGEAVLTHVRRGGGLLLIGHGGQWRATHPDAGRYDVYQANRLAKPLGYQFVTAGADLSVRGLLRVVPDERTDGAVHYETSESPGTLADLAGTGTSLVETAAGSVVLSAKPYGRGRVACCADPTGFVPSGANAELVARTLRWLAPDGGDALPGPPASTVPPEVRVSSDSVSVAVSQAFCSAETADALATAVHNIATAVAERAGPPSSDPARIVVLPAGAPPIQGAVCLPPCSPSDPWELVAACARSATDTTVRLPALPQSLDRGLVEWVALTALADLGYVRAAALLERYRRTWREASPEEAAALGLPPDQAPPGLALARAVARVDTVARRLGPHAWSGFLDLLRGRGDAVGDQELVTTVRLAFERSAPAVLADLGSQVEGGTLP